MVCGRGEVGEPVPGGESLLVPVNQLMHDTHKVLSAYAHCAYTNTHCVYKHTFCVCKYILCAQIHTMCMIHTYCRSTDAQAAWPGNGSIFEKHK